MSTKIKHLFFLITLSLMPLSALAVDDELPCPDSPNCVSSLVEGKQSVAPFMFRETNPAKIYEELLSVLEQLGYSVNPSNGHIIHAVFTSSWLKFEDDLILLINEGGRVDVKSASRVGYYDFGANRKRVEKLRALLQSELLQP